MNIELLTQRRVWATVVSMVAFSVTITHANFNIDQVALTDLLTNLGVALSQLITAGLSIWSYLKPKNK